MGKLDKGAGRVHTVYMTTTPTDPTYRVQEVSVDGSYIHIETFENFEEARDLASGIAARGSALLVSVLVIKDYGHGPYRTVAQYESEGYRKSRMPQPVEGWAESDRIARANMARREVGAW